MKELLTFALSNPALLVVPAVAFVLSLVMLRIEKRYLNEGILLTRKPATERDHRASKSAGNDMNAGNEIDIEIALRKFHELGLADGDLGYAYWHAVGQLVKRAAGMQAQIDALSVELEQSRATRQKRN
ncbi:hypothetical protein [Paraburkholderia sp. BCC1876]|uniref:hypothetical protein n=1 Tax=Paraburkholderia sp. BCC1876 TaxID=2676303 RepID=UPI001FC7CD55|nr:hypothetical protein [Paraburkholderia sp. BCC1876]